MAGGYTEVSKREPCPICGTADYCCSIPAKDGYGIVRVCKRYKDSRVINPGGDTPSTVDGAYYLLCGESHKGYGIYREANDVALAEQNGVKIWLAGGGTGDYQKGPGAKRKELIPVGINEVASDSTLDLYYRKLMSLYPLKKEHADYLRREGWSEKLISDAKVCSFPVEDWKRNWHKNCRVLPVECSMKRAEACAIIARELGEPVGIPGFYLHTDKKTGMKYWDINVRSGIGFPLFNQLGQIVRIRTRMDFLDVNKTYEKDQRGLFFKGEDDNKKRYVSWKGVTREEYDGTLVTEKDKKYRANGKYRGLSSFEQIDNDEAGTYTNRYENGTEGSNIVGLIEKPTDNPFIAILTEGEKKAFVGNAYLHSPTIIITGVSSFAKLFDTRVGKNILEHLIKQGTQCFGIAFDADKLQNESVLNSEWAFAQRLLQEGLKPVILNWNPEDGKGLDDFLINKNHGDVQMIELTKANIDSYYEPLFAKFDDIP